jgi:hypothetical protein
MRGTSAFSGGAVIAYLADLHINGYLLDNAGHQSGGSRQVFTG